jgi:hypothetical protein
MTKGHSDVTARLTDTSKYTGAHKERFDADGKGRLLTLLYLFTNFFLFVHKGRVSQDEKHL